CPATGRFRSRCTRPRSVVRHAGPSLRRPQRAEARRCPPRFPAPTRLRQGHRAGHRPRVEAGVRGRHRVTAATVRGVRADEAPARRRAGVRRSKGSHPRSARPAARHQAPSRLAASHYVRRRPVLAAVPDSRSRPATRGGSDRRWWPRRSPSVPSMPISSLAGDVDVAMMLATGALRVVLVTTHIPLKDVAAQVTSDRVVRCGRITERALRDWWGIAAPRLAVCALNPHGGESGLFGDEDERVLAPAARTLGAAGPLPADTVFVRALKGEFDAVLTPYHDVGMTAVKVAGFGEGVNVTLGLPFPRVAPDHGTALDIAGKGIADRRSMRAALERGPDL